MMFSLNKWYLTLHEEYIVHIVNNICNLFAYLYQTLPSHFISKRIISLVLSPLSEALLSHHCYIGTGIGNFVFAFFFLLRAEQVNMLRLACFPR